MTSLLRRARLGVRLAAPSPSCSSCSARRTVGVSALGRQQAATRELGRLLGLVAQVAEVKYSDGDLGAWQSAYVGDIYKSGSGGRAGPPSENRSHLRRPRAGAAGAAAQVDPPS